jgi:hypothetical protein
MVKQTPTKEVLEENHIYVHRYKDTDSKPWPKYISDFTEQLYGDLKIQPHQQYVGYSLFIFETKTGRVEIDLTDTRTKANPLTEIIHRKRMKLN